jgi:hypothetical protein
MRLPGKAVRRGGRVAEGARLESVFTGNRNVGSNPTPSATSEQNLGLGRPPEVRYQAAESVAPRLQRVLDALELSPAIVKNATWDVVAWNRAVSRMRVNRLLAKTSSGAFQAVRGGRSVGLLNKKAYFPAARLNRRPVGANKTAGLIIACASAVPRHHRRALLKSDRLATKGAKRPWLRLLQLCLMRPDASPPFPGVAANSLHWLRFRGIFGAYVRCRCGGDGGGYFILPASDGPL